MDSIENLNNRTPTKTINSLKNYIEKSNINWHTFMPISGIKWQKVFEKIPEIKKIKLECKYLFKRNSRKKYLQRQCGKVIFEEKVFSGAEGRHITLDYKWFQRAKRRSVKKERKPCIQTHQSEI